MSRFRSLQIDATAPVRWSDDRQAVVTTESWLVHPRRPKADDRRYSYCVRVVWRSRNCERAEPEEVTIDYGRGDLSGTEPVTASVIRELPLGEMIDEGRRALIKAARRADRLQDLGIGPAVDWSQFERAGPRQGSPIPPEQDALVAAEYRRAHGRGEPVTEAVATKLGVSHSTASKRIMRPRKAGLLDGIGPKR